MKTKYLLFIASLSAALIARAEDALPKTLMTERGKLLVSEDLASRPAEVSDTNSINSLKSGWRFKPGQWDFANGALTGSQVKADNHSAAAFLAVPFHDAVIQFEVRLDGARLVHFCVDDPHALRPPTPTRPAQNRVEHLCRVILDQNGFTAQKDDHDHDGPDTAIPFGTVKQPFKPGEWKTVLVELKGEEMVATVEGHSIAGADPLIASDKAYLSFGVTGYSNGFDKVPPLSASFRRLRIWEALPNQNWPASKAALAPAK